MQLNWCDFHKPQTSSTLSRTKYFPHVSTGIRQQKIGHKATRWASAIQPFSHARPALFAQTRPCFPGSSQGMPRRERGFGTPARRKCSLFRSGSPKSEPQISEEIPMEVTYHGGRLCILCCIVPDSGVILGFTPWSAKKDGLEARISLDGMVF